MFASCAALGEDGGVERVIRMAWKYLSFEDDAGSVHAVAPLVLDQPMFDRPVFLRL